MSGDSDKVGGCCGVATMSCSCGSVARRARALATLLGLGQLRLRRKLGRQTLIFLLGGAFLAFTLGCCGWKPKSVWVGHHSLPKGVIKHSSTLVQLCRVGFCQGFLFLLGALFLYSWLWVVAWVASCLVSSWANCGARHWCLVFWSKMFGDVVVYSLIVQSGDPSCAILTPKCIVFRLGFPL